MVSQKTRHARKQAQSTSWAIPKQIRVARDELRMRLDIYDESILMTRYDRARASITRMVSALDISAALTRNMRLFSGILPEEALWWGSGPDGGHVALWRAPRQWRVALQTEAFKPPRRFALPMPGLVFLCQPAAPPRVFAAKRRPQNATDLLYRAPLFNVFRDGRTCQGNHRYPAEVEKIPESFFASHFSIAGDTQDRSRLYPRNLLSLWETLV